MPGVCDSHGPTKFESFDCWQLRIWPFRMRESEDASGCRGSPKWTTVDLCPRRAADQARQSRLTGSGPAEEVRVIERASRGSAAPLL
jgi:hypothetical protein